MYESTEKWKIHLYTIILILLIATASLATCRIAYQYFYLDQQETKTGSVRVMYQVNPPEALNSQIWEGKRGVQPKRDFGMADEWFSVGPSQWIMNSFDESKKQNYSILTDLMSNYTGNNFNFPKSAIERVPYHSVKLSFFHHEYFLYVSQLIFLQQSG